MKLGVHAALWMRTWSDDVAPLVQEAGALGYEAVELSLLGGEPDARRRVRDVAREAGVELTCTTGLGPATDVGGDEPEVRAAGRAALAEAVRATAQFGAGRLSGVLYGAWGRADPGRREDRWAWAVEALAETAPLAHDEGIVLGIEAINRYETDLVNTADQALAMVDAVGAPNVGVLLDAYHMNIEEKDPAAAIRRCGSRLVHLHVAGRDRGVPDRDDLERHGLREALHEIGYDGCVTCEMFVQAGQPVSPDLTVWRAIEPDPGDAARRALRVLRAWSA
jgi:D-psicose/D-tagatose/L-ribulose 3-epimerase